MKIKLITLFSALSACLIAPDASLQAIEYSTPKPTNQTVSTSNNKFSFLPNQQTPNPYATPKAVESTNHNTNGQNPNIQIEQHPTLIDTVNIYRDVPEDTRNDTAHLGPLGPSCLSSFSNPNCYYDAHSQKRFYVSPNYVSPNPVESLNLETSHTWSVYSPDPSLKLCSSFLSIQREHLPIPAETSVHLYTHADERNNLLYTTTNGYHPSKSGYHPSAPNGCDGHGILWRDHVDGYAKPYSSTSPVPYIIFEKNSGKLYFSDIYHPQYIRVLFSSTESRILSNMPKDPATHNGLYLANIYKDSHHEALVQYLGHFGINH